MIEEITINIHSSIRIKGDRVIYFDPYKIEEETHDADVIFITHDHYDHFEPSSIEKILRDDTMMVIPKTCFDAWSDSGLIVTQVVQMGPGEQIDMGGLVIETIPAYNLLKPFHPKRKNWLGYIVTLEGRRIYVAGDTDVTEETRKVQCDIAFIPVGGKYTMNAAKAADLVNEIGPEIAVPTHYGSVVGRESDGRDFKDAVREGIRVPLLIKRFSLEDQEPETGEDQDKAGGETEAQAAGTEVPAEETAGEGVSDQAAGAEAPAGEAAGTELPAEETAGEAVSDQAAGAEDPAEEAGDGYAAEAEESTQNQPLQE